MVDKENDKIYITAEDDLASVVSRLRQVPSKRVVLVVPPRSVILKSLINLKILKKEADKVGKEIVIMASDTSALALAKRLGLAYAAPVVDSSEEKPKDEKLPPPPPFSRRFPLFEVKGWLRKKEGEEELKPRRSLWYFIFAGAALGIVLLTFYIWLPRSLITLDIQAQPFAYRFLFILADKESSGVVGNNVFYGRFIETTKEVERSFEVTGSKNVGEKAWGEMIVENYSGSIQSLVAGTRFVNSSPADSNLVFRTQTDVFIPTARISSGGEVQSGRAKVEVLADSGGTAGNLPPSQFTLPGLSGRLAELIKAHSEKAFSGGRDDLCQVVSEEDIKRAQELAGKEIFAQAREKLESKVRRGEEILPDLIQEEIIESVPSAVEGEEAEELVVKTRVRIWTIVTKGGTFDNNLQASLSKVLPKGKIVTPETEKNIVLETTLANLVSRSMELSVLVDGMIAGDFSSLSFKKSIAGKTVSEVEETLREKLEILSFKIRLWPFWVKRTPRLLSHLKLQTRYLTM